MVAPFSIGDKVKSFVRVPGSGSDPTAVVSCCDLSRIANIAPASSLPTVLRGTATSVPATRGDDTASSVDVPALPASKCNALKRPLTTTEDTQPPKKAVCTEQTSPPVQMSNTYTPAQLEQLFSRMLEERDGLKKENMELKKKLQMFHQLFRNRDKLNEVLKLLDSDTRSSTQETQSVIS